MRPKKLREVRRQGRSHTAQPAVDDVLRVLHTLRLPWRPHWASAQGQHTPDPCSPLLPPCLLDTPSFLKGAGCSLACTPPRLPPELQQPHNPGWQGQLHTCPLVPEGPHGDAELPHEVPHGTATTLHA